MEFKPVDWGFVAKAILRHMLFWAVVVTYFAWGFGLQQNPARSFINASLFLPGFVIMVYSLLYVLVPRYLLKRKFLLFFAGLFVVVAICSLYSILMQLSINTSRDFKGMTLSVGRNVLPFLHVGGIALSIKLLKHWYQQKQQTLEAERQKAAAELKLLKAQLHPHFLFNTLNNLYAHTLEASPKSPEIVMKLSELLRFMIYESNTPKIPLTKEIHLLENYITLEKLRYGNRLDMSVTITGDVAKYQIAPFLLLPFLENAFKHGTSKQLEQCWISLNISMEGSVMNFKLVNSIDEDTLGDKDGPGGLGLSNTRKRLELLYKNSHVFETRRLEDVYVVDLRITLEELEKKYEEMEVSYSG
jgi:sensor histidine kinase YesM